eukprot:TRINITY_DN36615_c0_g1_i1.p1 TRINITY_DN36615_c0_g1~~TRINITY_DN36615_c0_g1_i1.p1  ORF type:complete len:632 (+),score=153.71 TRINITY_DN36615_c0_g1_i1:54-1949(+)
MRESVSISAGRSNPFHVPEAGLIGQLIKFCDWESRSNLFCLNSSWFGLIGDSDAEMWHFLTEALAHEKGSYLSKTAVRTETLKEAFFRHKGLDATEFNITVCTRFRDICAGDKPREGAAAAQKKVILPLHQRLTAIRATHGITNNADAGRILMKGDSKTPGFEFNMMNEDNKENRKRRSTTDASNADVKHPKTSPGDDIGTVMDVSPEGSVLTRTPGIGIRAFDFDGAFQRSTQRAVYNKCASPIVEDFVNGTDACCIVYGQTGSGKTYTMFGTDANPGIVPLSCSEVISALGDKLSECELAVSYIEIFGDEVTDLLREGAFVHQNKSAAQRWVLEGKTQNTVRSLADIHELLAKGDLCKRRAATSMNDRSSRAHSLFILTLCKNDVRSTLVLADLGGSEDARRSGVTNNIIGAGKNEEEGTSNWSAYYQSRVRMMEAININRGLLAFRNCIRALHEKQDRKQADHYIPYQDSKLTLLLANVLGGKARTSILITASPLAEDNMETINSLRFGEDCRAITTEGSRVDANTAAVRRAIRSLDSEIAEAQTAVKKAESWVQEKVRRKREAACETEVTTVDGEDGLFHLGTDGVAHAAMEEEEELVTVYRLRGGTEEAKHLEALLNKRRCLLGTI